MNPVVAKVVARAEARRQSERDARRAERERRQAQRKAEQKPMNPRREVEYVEMEDCYIGAVTEKAIQIHHDGEIFWVPKSVIQDPEQFGRYDEGCLVLVAEWFARKEGLI
jgi:hypothetical protein